MVTTTGRSTSKLYSPRFYCADIYIGDAPSLIGKTLSDANILRELGLTPTAISREGIGRIPIIRQEEIKEGDVILVQGYLEDVLRLKSHPGNLVSWYLDFYNELPEEYFEVMVLRSFDLVGRTLKRLKFYDRYRLLVFGFSRIGTSLLVPLNSIPLRFGDILLIQGEPEQVEQLMAQGHLSLVEQISTKRLTGRAGFYSCFISYSSKDHPFAERLHADLQNEGVRCWFAPEDLKIGAEIRVGIDESIRVHDKLLLVLSETSVKSQWVQQEVETALAKEREQNRTVLFPIRLDDAVMQLNTGWPAYLKNTRNIGDFRNWIDDNSYSKAFDRLLRDLKAEDKQAAESSNVGSPLNLFKTKIETTRKSAEEVAFNEFLLKHPSAHITTKITTLLSIEGRPMSRNELIERLYGWAERETIARNLARLVKEGTLIFFRERQNVFYRLNTTSLPGS